jgi:hypothetical protein
MTIDAANEEVQEKSHFSSRFISMIALLIGFALVAGAGFVAWHFFQRFGLAVLQTTEGKIFFGGFVIVLVVALYIGSRIIQSNISIRKDVIRAEDRALLEPLIRDANEKAVDQYVRLSSLTGMTGLATKLGLTGLPLITVALTLIFAGLHLYSPTNGEFMDLTKLTLGAFIGSFVQRAATTQAIVQSGKVPPVA